ncbi:L-histidine N(alpha)-methyltransferase [Tropicibacter sp. R15_0]|uniref:L-histidine N(alpha)-methyltransferase n=1 Tax=Tropicibacter sp. R15_0 TaxID=2821101 RepID=UPI001AD95CA0|nr:L-histidine N(alpha)-methyltransferase [Tropicibacter sp. R15_0]MBO9465623.1 L-histidine N(alpha)-methyltransferase [Tropicibacter sp. R15_0]
MDKPVITHSQLASSAIETLSRPQKALEAKWFYDHRGSELFEAITQLPEYYPTRTEIAILEDKAAQLARFVRDGGVLMELGSGASVKTRILLDALPRLGAYMPLDISGEFLQLSAAQLRRTYPGLQVTPIVADFMQALPPLPGAAHQPVTVFFPGSTIGNLEPETAIALLQRIRNLPQVHALILGADLIKEESRLIAAYDDAQGVTAEFNLNLLRRLNFEAGANFELAGFGHEARWNAEQARIEMHLVSSRTQEVQIGAERFRFETGESIHTENSHKYSHASLSQMAEQSGWQLAQSFTDANKDFSVSVLAPTVA